MWDEVNEAIPQLSESVGAVQVTTALHRPASAFWVMSEGIPAMAGSSSSVTVTVKLAVVTLLWMSVDV